MATTALVTGASSGIGGAFARLLAARGHDLVLVARRRERLEQLREEVEAEHGVTAEVLAADLSDSTELATLEQRIGDTERPVEIVVNNAGAGRAGAFGEMALDHHLDQLALNVTAVLRLSHAAARAMLPRGHGAILNVSSIGGLAPAPRFATYGACKAFVVSLTEALHEELRPNGIRVTCLCPGATRTEFGENAGSTGEQVPDFVWMTAEQVARAGLAALDRNQAVCVAGGFNRAVAVLSHLMPRVAVRRVSGFVAERL